MNLNRKLFLKTIAIILTLLAGAGWSYSQFENEPQRVSLALYKSLDRQPLGRSLVVAVKVTIEKGWHIHSNSPNDEFLVPTSFDLLTDENYQISEITYPDPLVLKLSFSEEPVLVFEGEILIGVVIDLPEGLELGTHEIPVELYYQACNDLTCEPPQAVNASLNITVVDSRTEVKEINSDIFAKIKID